MFKKILFFIYVFLLLSSFVTSNLNDGLIGYWAFDGTPNDNTSNGNNFVVNGNANLKQGILGQAYYYDGNDDYLNFADINNYFDFDTNANNNNTVKTIVFWINSSALTDDILISKWSSDTAVKRWGIYSNTNCEAGYNICDGWGTAGTIWKGIGSLIANKWYMITVRQTSNNAKINLSVNSSNMREVSGSYTAKSNNFGNLRIGCEGVGCTSDFQGYIDELGIWNRTLTDIEINQLYNNGIGLTYPFGVNIAGVEPSLIVYSDLNLSGLKYNTTTININYNGTSINNSNIYNCQLFFNNELNNVVNNSNLAIQNNISLINLAGYYENDFNISLKCDNENTTGINYNIVSIDNKKPTLNYIGFKNTYSNTENVFINFSIIDNNLTFFNIETKRAGLTFDNITHDNIKINTYDVFNISTTSYNIGNFDYSLLVYDGYQYAEFSGNYNITTESGLSTQTLMEINNNIIDFKNKFIEVFGMLGFILINMLYLFIIYYFVIPVSEKFKFITIIPAINIILISFYTLGINIFSEYLFNTYILISSILFFVVLLLSYIIGLFTTKGDKPNKKNFYSEFN